MLAAIASAVSGMRAATLRLEASTSNIANQDSQGALEPTSGAPEACRPVHVEPSSLAGPNGMAGGTRATVRSASPAWLAAHNADASFADADGMVATPNVDLIAAKLEQIGAETSYLANLRVLEAAQDMVKRLYELND